MPDLAVELHPWMLSWMPPLHANPAAWRIAFRKAPLQSSPETKIKWKQQKIKWPLSSIMCAIAAGSSSVAKRCLPTRPGSTNIHMNFAGRSCLVRALDVPEDFHSAQCNFRHATYIAKACKHVFHNLPDSDPEEVDIFWRQVQGPKQKSLLKPPVLVDRCGA